MDQALFDLINQQWTHPVLDRLLPLYRDKVIWVPLYLLWAVLLVRYYGWRRTLYLLLCIGLVVGVADQLAATVLKPWVGRLRPCAVAALADRVRELVPCGGAYGFPSNHATNHFAVATVLALTWVRRRGYQVLLYLWAGSIALAQVYVGKHYPGDVLAGAVLGVLVAVLGVYGYRRWAGAAAI